VLQPEQFHRFLRQAHDAEIADVRKLGENEFEVLVRGREAVAAAAAAPAPSDDTGQHPTVDAASGAGGIRFRRGSRTGAAVTAIPMVGVVKLDGGAPEAPPEEKPARGRRKAARPADSPPSRKRGGGRTKKKADG
jgi:hypothetical protein